MSVLFFVYIYNSQVKKKEIQLAFVEENDSQVKKKIEFALIEKGNSTKQQIYNKKEDPLDYADRDESLSVRARKYMSTLGALTFFDNGFTPDDLDNIVAYKEEGIIDVYDSNLSNNIVVAKHLYYTNTEGKISHSVTATLNKEGVFVPVDVEYLLRYDSYDFTILSDSQALKILKKKVQEKEYVQIDGFYTAPSSKKGIYYLFNDPEYNNNFFVHANTGYIINANERIIKNKKLENLSKRIDFLESNPPIKFDGNRYYIDEDRIDLYKDIYIDGDDRNRYIIDVKYINALLEKGCDVPIDWMKKNVKWPEDKKCGSFEENRELFLKIKESVENPNKKEFDGDAPILNNDDINIVEVSNAQR